MFIKFPYVKGYIYLMLLAAFPLNDMILNV